MHGQPGSQVREVMKEKEILARVLLTRGLTQAQVRGQLCCSRYFVQRIVQEMRDESQYQQEE